ncbi:MAG TPA: hypothetical protein QF730_02860 [Planctomycetota bacterium]|jgi:hypothetical protein|nr:hypothetical protein [Planctomycetota bacterium]
MVFHAQHSLSLAPLLTAELPASPLLAAEQAAGRVAAAQLLGEPDWIGLGLVLAIVGGFLIANAILWRHPRSMIRSHFGRRPLELRTIRETIFHRMQTSLGFTCLLLGFGCMLVGRFRPQAAEQPLTLAWVGLVVVAVGALLAVGWWYSLMAFRRYLREYINEHPGDFEKDLAMAREIGALFGVSARGDDTVQTFLERVRRKAHLPRPERLSGGYGAAEFTGPDSSDSAFGLGDEQGSESTEAATGHAPPGAEKRTGGLAAAPRRESY